MQTRFSAEALAASPDLARSESILRKCVHCGFCTATCPTYLLLGDEADSPRGRIYLIQNMLEAGGPPPAATVRHVDRCLSCLSCRTTCPSGVNYMHLVDHARAHIERHYRRPLADRLLRGVVSAVLTRPSLFRLACRAGAALRVFAPLLPGRWRGLLTMAPRTLPRRTPVATGPAGRARLRVGLVQGCVQPVLAPSIDEAAVRLLTRLGAEVVVQQRPACCGALPHHLGQSARAHALARQQIAYWRAEMARAPLDAIVLTTSGCGTTLKDYGAMFRDDPEWAAPAAAVAALVRDVTEVLDTIGLDGLPLAPPAAPPSARPAGLNVAYHSACSLRHGQGITAAPRRLLESVGYRVVEPVESHICCGSAGTYNILQPELATRLKQRKVGHLEALGADVIAAGNVGCLNQIGSGTALPVVHTVELLDWATGGPRPAALGPTAAPSGRSRGGA